MPGVESDGHSSYNPQLDIDSFYSLESRLSQEHPEWSAQEQRREALTVFNTRMFPNQVRGFISEKRGDQEMAPNTEWAVVDGKLVHPEYGAFDKMIEHAQTPEEAEALRLYQDTMVSAPAGTRVMAFDLHATNDGVHSVRYADISLKTTEGKVRLEKRIDISESGRSLNLAESWDKLDFLAKGKGRQLITAEKNSQAGILVMFPNDNSGLDNLARELQAPRAETKNLRHQEARSEEKSFKENHHPDQVSVWVNETQRIGEKVAADLYSTAVVVRQFVSQRTAHQEIRRETKGSKKTLVEKLRRFWVKEKAPPRVLSPEKPRQERDDTSYDQRVKRKLIIEQVRLVMAFATETGVGMGAASWGLRLTSELPPNQVELFSREKKTKKLKGRNKEELLSRTIESQGFKPKVRTEERQRIKTKEGRRRKERQLKTKKRWERRQLNPPLTEGVKRPRFSETRLGQRSKVEKALKPRQGELTVVVWRLAKRMVEVRAPLRKFSPKDKQSQEVKQTAKRESLSRRAVETRRSSEISFAFAWMFWWWLKLDRPKIRPRANTHEKPIKVTRETLVGQEPTPWVLLAIIWYLAMLREQGLRNVPPKKKNKQKTKRGITSSFSRPLPPQGVIFAFNS